MGPLSTKLAPLLLSHAEFTLEKRGILTVPTFNAMSRRFFCHIFMDQTGKTQVNTDTDAQKEVTEDLNGMLMLLCFC